MGIIGYALGGALQGLGSGMQKDVQARRDEALQAMRDKTAADAATLADQRQSTRDATKHGYDVEDAQALAGSKLDQLSAAARADAAKAQVQHVYKLDEIDHENVGKRELATLESNLGTARDQASIRLRDQLQSGDVSNVVRGKDGQYYGVTDKGLVPTGVNFDPSSGDKSSDGGGRLTEAEQVSALDDARSDWRKSGKQGAEPRASDFIGMTRETYYQRTGRPSGVAATAAPVGDVTPSSAGGTGAASQQATAMAQLGTVYANATPDRYPGLFRNGRKISLADAKQMVLDRYQ